MKLTVEIPDELVDAVRDAFMQQDLPATDEQLAAAAAAHLLSTSAYIHESHLRAALKADSLPTDLADKLATARALRKASPSAFDAAADAIAAEIEPREV